MREVTAQALRDLVGEAMAPTIDLHRASRAYAQDSYVSPSGPPTDEEIDDFLFHNPLLDEETISQLTDPGLLGFAGRTAKASDEWMADFQDAIDGWADNQSWIAGDESLRVYIPGLEPFESNLWTPSGATQPGWIATAPAYMLLAADILNQGKLLSELSWRDFENLIGDLLQSEGWTVRVTQGTRDGGIDVIATKDDPVLGTIRSLWQAKKYNATNKVKLHEVRELSAVRDDLKATKAMMVTTSALTRDAIEWVKRDLYRLGYKEHDQIKQWLGGALLR